MSTPESLAEEPRVNSPLPVQHRRRRVHSVNFEAADDAWVESVVDLLRRAGSPRAGRSEVTRVALAELRRLLTGHGPVETVKFFIDREAERRLSLVQTQEKFQNQNDGGGAT